MCQLGILETVTQRLENVCKTIILNGICNTKDNNKNPEYIFTIIKSVQISVRKFYSSHLKLQFPYTPCLLDHC